ncbi:uncharacterized protein LOC143551829 [Bidens hawaiensis]|uniref:uncharacterized protein LOC143551829 n=1 Tax=Bidens hawaiensis TaxID=980011 RepID=UPI004049DD34
MKQAGVLILSTTQLGFFFPLEEQIPNFKTLKSISCCRSNWEDGKSCRVLLLAHSTFKKEEAEVEFEEERSDEESEESSDEESDRKKGTQGVIEIENPNMARPKTLKAKDADLDKTTELSRREREEIAKQRAHERYMKLQEQGKTEQARKNLERLALIRQQRAEAAKKREEEKAGNVQSSFCFLKAGFGNGSTMVSIKTVFLVLFMIWLG